MSDVERIPSAPAGENPPPAGESPTPERVRDVIRRVDHAWAEFRAAAARFPSERMDEHLTEHGWTRKQMLAHIGLWHDLTHDRLGQLIVAGKPAPLDQEVDALNARAARVAVGKTAGEVAKDTEASFGRLRRQLQRLTDEQLQAHRGWAANVVAKNTYEHYAEHMDDLYVAETPEGAGRR